MIEFFKKLKISSVAQKLSLVGLIFNLWPISVSALSMTSDALPLVPTAQVQPAQTKQATPTAVVVKTQTTPTNNLIPLVPTAEPTNTQTLQSPNKVLATSTNTQPSPTAQSEAMTKPESMSVANSPEIVESTQYLSYPNGWQREVGGNGDWVKYENNKIVQRIGWNWEFPNSSPSASGRWILRNHLGQEIASEDKYKLAADTGGVFIGYGSATMPAKSDAEAKMTSTILFPIVFGGGGIFLLSYWLHAIVRNELREPYRKATEQTTNEMDKLDRGNDIILGRRINNSEFYARVYKLIKRNPENGTDHIEPEKLNRIIGLIEGMRNKIAAATAEQLDPNSPASDAIVRRLYVTERLPKEMRMLLGELDQLGPDRAKIVMDALEMPDYNSARSDLTNFARICENQPGLGFDRFLSHIGGPGGYRKDDFAPTYNKDYPSEWSQENFIKQQEKAQRKRNGGVTDQALEAARSITSTQKLTAVKGVSANGQGIKNALLEEIAKRKVLLNSQQSPQERIKTESEINGLNDLYAHHAKLIAIAEEIEKIETDPNNQTLTPSQMSLLKAQLIMAIEEHQRNAPKNQAIIDSLDNSEVKTYLRASRILATPNTIESRLNRETLNNELNAQPIEFSETDLIQRLKQTQEIMGSIPVIKPPEERVEQMVIKLNNQQRPQHFPSAPAQPWQGAGQQGFDRPTPAQFSGPGYGQQPNPVDAARRVFEDPDREAKIRDAQLAAAQAQAREAQARAKKAEAEAAKAIAAQQNQVDAPENGRGSARAAQTGQPAPTPALARNQSSFDLTIDPQRSPRSVLPDPGRASRVQRP